MRAALACILIALSFAGCAHYDTSASERRADQYVGDIIGR